MGETVQFTTEMGWVLAILAFTIYLFVSEVVRVDVAAILVMVMIGVISAFFPLFGFDALVTQGDLFSGFASNAVISIIAVMIIGAGLDKTGVMNKVAAKILQMGGTAESRIVTLISGTVGIISSFMQNIGAAALFLPVVNRISRRTGIPMSRLLMPMGFCAILGGTVTMIGSSPLILLGGLIENVNEKTMIPAGQDPMAAFNMFDVTPIGLVLVGAGILYFIVAGKFILPSVKNQDTESADTLNYFKRVYNLDDELFEVNLKSDSPLVGNTVGEAQQCEDCPMILALMKDSEVIVAPPRNTLLESHMSMVVMTSKDKIKAMQQEMNFDFSHEMLKFNDYINPGQAGISELVIPPESSLIGKLVKDLGFRRQFGLSVLKIYRANKSLEGELDAVTLQSGDTLVVHSRWENLHYIEQNPDFVVVTENPYEEVRPSKLMPAVISFAAAISLILLNTFGVIEMKLSTALFVGAIGMILTRVLSIDEAYRAVGWQTVFLLASLIPLGTAVQTTGTATWIAQEVLGAMGELLTPLTLQIVIAVLGTIFTLVMSNVGATVLLVPLAVTIAIQAGGIEAGYDPRLFALTVAISTSNSFLIPTHQVNALIMGPGGYSVKDFVKAGGIMTLLFLVLSITMLNVVF